MEVRRATLDVGDGLAVSAQGEVSLGALHVLLGPLGGESDKGQSEE